MHSTGRLAVDLHQRVLNRDGACWLGGSERATLSRRRLSGELGEEVVEDVEPLHVDAVEADGDVVRLRRVRSLCVVHNTLGHVQHIAWLHVEVTAVEFRRVLHRVRRATLHVVARELLQHAQLRVAELHVNAKRARELLPRHARAPRLGAVKLPHKHVVRVRVRLEHLCARRRRVEVYGGGDARKVEERVRQPLEGPPSLGEVLEAQHERVAAGHRRPCILRRRLAFQNRGRLGIAAVHLGADVRKLIFSHEGSDVLLELVDGPQDARIEAGLFVLEEKQRLVVVVFEEGADRERHHASRRRCLLRIGRQVLRASCTCPLQAHALHHEQQQAP
mmetsp:Transcript_58762/g.134804  ORF Transcript_58762/g.134804 Transcript_58762/m.134804 type:complete len:333 (+) Transcript_58762:1349-2347(+)